PPWLASCQRLRSPLTSLTTRTDAPSGAGCIAMIRRVAKNCSNRYRGRALIDALPPLESVANRTPLRFGMVQYMYVRTGAAHLALGEWPLPVSVMCTSQRKEFE